MKHLKPFRRLFALFFASILLGSCSTVSKFSSAKTIDITPLVVQKPTVADLVVKEAKVTGNFSGKSMTIPLETIKSEAVAAALKTVNADVLIEPRFDYVINGKLTTVTVSGFPAIYKNFRPIKPEDIQLLHSGIVRQVTTFTPPVLTQKKGPKIGKIVLITLGTLLAVSAIGALAAYDD
jgi:hypothetical protein